MSEQVLGFGVHGSVFACRTHHELPGRNAVKIHDRREPYRRERDAYLRAAQYQNFVKFVADGRAIRFDLSTGAALEEWTTPSSPRVTCPLLVAHDGQSRIILSTASEDMPDYMRTLLPNVGALFWAPTDLPAPSAEIIRLTE